MSVEGSDGASVSRQSNLNKSVNAATTGKPESQREAVINSIVSEFAARYPERATLPVATDHGRSIRRDYANVTFEEWTEDQPDIEEFELERAVSGVGEGDVSAVEWGEAVRELVDSYLRTEETTLHFERGVEGAPEHQTFDVAAENRWFSSYQKRYFAQLDGWLRELTGGKRPSGGETEASFDNPHVALITRSASSVPNGERVGPVDHVDELRSAWSDCYHTLRNTLRAEGYELGEDWQYDRRLEPHTGKRGDHGTNECYAHEHIIVVVDGEVTGDTLRPVIDKHVEACEWAGEAAHGEEAIEVREPSELNDVAAYVADYCSIDPVPLVEREADYIGWAAAMTAGNVRTVSRSETAVCAAQADACKQRAESGESEQEVAHGEELTVSSRAGYSVECLHCGSPHGIDQDRSLAATRLDNTASVAADGGVEVMDEAERRNDLRARWRDASGGVQVGEGLAEREARERAEMLLSSSLSRREVVVRVATVTEVAPGVAERVVAEVCAGVSPERPVSFERVPEWRLTGVTVGEERHGASAGSGVEMVETTEPRREVRGALPDALFRCDCGVGAGREGMARHLVDVHGIEDPAIALECVRRE